VKGEDEEVLGDDREEEAEEKEQKVKSEKGENYQVGKWTKEEHTRFMEAFNAYGKNWKKIQECVATRTITQVRSHAQKCLPGHSSTIRNSKEQAEPGPLTPPKTAIPKARKRAQGNKVVNGVKKGKVNPEGLILKSELYPEPTTVLGSSSVIYSGTGDMMVNQMIHYQVNNELENPNDNLDFDLDFSETEIKPLNLDEGEVTMMWRHTEADEEIVSKLLT
jgi:SHAQKYF class myb-like DNA-binding protein